MTIERRPFGRTGHASSAVIFGAAALGKVGQGTADEVLDLLLEHGVNHIDVAASYGDAELRIGPWMDRHRDAFFLATKTGEREYAAARDEIHRSLERLRTDRIVGCFSDGASHIWEHAGITTEWLNASNNGRVSVEMKVQPASRIAAGEALELVSRVADQKGRTFRLVHTLRSLKDGRVAARGEVCCLVMSLESRRAVALPESFSAYLSDHSL